MAVPSVPASSTILVVDDDELVRAITSRMLRDEGFAVLTARDGFEALQIINQSIESLALIVSDLKMPRMTGRQLAERLPRPIPMLFVSGHPDAVLAGALAGPLLMKPFTAHDLVSAVIALLAPQQHQPV